MTSASPKPGQIDQLAISLRAYIESRPENRKRASLRPSEWALIIDTETTTDPGQALRFGTYQVRKGGALCEAGIFYRKRALTARELKTIKAFSKQHGLECITVEQFVNDVLYRIGYELRATIVGFNLPFDISRLAIGHGSARKEMRGGFTFRLSDDKRKPPIQVKHLSRKASLIRFAAPFRQRRARSSRKRGEQRIRRGFFVDVHTLAAALFARSFTLKTLADFLAVKHQKLSADEHGAPIARKYLQYAVRDAETTWECYDALVKRYLSLELHDTHPPQIFSEASIGKAYLRAMGVRPWRETQPAVPSAMLARILGCYYGGRSEVRIRREVLQVVLCDFLSMYPTVCTLMRLWQFVIAAHMEWHDSTQEVRQFLENVKLGDLRCPTTWANLTALVRIEPDWDVLPVRAHYEDAGQATIGANYLKADEPMWFTLADCIASKLTTGKTTKIIEALTFEPGKPQSGLRSVAIAGNRDYLVDPTRHDFYRRLIELRNDVKVKRDKASGPDRQSLDTEQNALKIAANATSYGIFVEVNVKDIAKRHRITVQTSTGRSYEVDTFKDESPGRFFHPVLATLITGAARLMLAVAERLVGDRNMEWAFCDTDSMAIAKPQAMPETDFHARVDEIVAWFTDLNPYQFGGSILKVEDVNFGLKNPKARERLFCWAVSAKRYALFNLDAEGRAILRKASAHGLGHLRAPYDASNPAVGIPTPLVPPEKMGVELWQHDLWWKIVSAALAGTPDEVALDYHPALTKPSISRYAATTPKLLRWFAQFNGNRPFDQQVKPFGFLYSLQAQIFAEDTEEVFITDLPRRRKSRASVKPVSPYDTDLGRAVAQCFDRETGQHIAQSMLMSYRQAIAHYHMHPESKFINGDYLDRGTTRRRHVHATAIRNIGKEANEWEPQFFLGFDEDEQVDYGLAPNVSKQFLTSLRWEIDAAGGQRRLARDAGVSRRTLSRFMSGSKTRRAVVVRIMRVLKAR